MGERNHDRLIPKREDAKPFLACAVLPVEVLKTERSDWASHLAVFQKPIAEIRGDSVMLL